jgi:hypothetical protein
MAVNGIARRRGKVFRDRYFRQDLRSPTQVRNALLYVMFNIQKHDTTHDWTGGIDTYTLAVWFEGWDPKSAPPPSGRVRAGPPLGAEAESWLARTGWRVRGCGCSNNDAPRCTTPICGPHLDPWNWCGQRKAHARAEELVEPWTSKVGPLSFEPPRPHEKDTSVPRAHETLEDARHLVLVHGLLTHR